MKSSAFRVFGLPALTALFVAAIEVRIANLDEIGTFAIGALVVAIMVFILNAWSMEKTTAQNKVPWREIAKLIATQVFVFAICAAILNGILFVLLLNSLASGPGKLVPFW